MRGAGRPGRRTRAGRTGRRDPRRRTGQRAGRGSVRVSVRDLTDALAFDVADEGALDVEPGRLFDRGHSGGDTVGTGIGLALARDLAASLGGRLLLTNAGPTTFTLLVPVRQKEGHGERRDEYEGAGPRDGVADPGA